jgi:predicted DNA-binding transcriptional regulator AlpA
MKPATIPTTHSSLNPEWIRVSEACEFARVSKPVIYDWMNKGWIKNVSLRQRGQMKGTRLISFDSLRGFLESRATGGDA